MAGIASIIDGLDIPDPVKEDMKAVYALIAEAESHAHGMPVDQIQMCIRDRKRSRHRPGIL